jgi:DNA-binding MarR family transcriptional regulator
MRSVTIDPVEVAGPPQTTEVVSRLRLAVNRLARRMRQQADVGIGQSLFSALVALDRAERMTLGELAATEQVQPPTMTRIAASLEARGLVARLPDPVDRRVAWISVTPEGRRLLDRTRNRKNAYLAKRLRSLSDADRRSLERALPILERLIEDPR